jgi:Zn-finger nucleic acid-binding protein
VSAIERRECPSCGESNGPDAAVCWACGKGFVGPVIGTCPRCEGHLREVVSGAVKIGACDGCNGVWAEEGMIVDLLRQPASAREQVLRQVERTRTGKIRKLHEGLVCRTCELILLRAPMMVSSEPVDTCPGCSATFLEEGVLPLMLRSGEVW